MIQTEATPNPDSIKFLSEKTISASGTEEFQKEQKNKITIPFVKELLEFKGVELILLSEKFLSVKKTKEVSWNELKPMIISHLNDYFSKNNEPILNNKKKPANNANNNSEIVNKIMEVLDTKIRPAVAGVVKVLLQGSCSGCPSSLMTLKQGVQNLLKHYVNEVNTVEAVQ